MAPLQGLNPLVLDTATESNRADIREYLRHELASHLQIRPDADRLVEQILEKSEGVFLCGVQPAPPVVSLDRKRSQGRIPHAGCSVTGWAVGASGVGSDVTLDSADSGINLTSPSDSGLSLEEEPLDLAGSGPSLELPEEEEEEAPAEAAPAESEETAQFQQDEEFLLSPSDEMGADETDNGSQVIALDGDDMFGEEQAGIAEELEPALLAEEPAGLEAPLEDLEGEGPFEKEQRNAADPEKGEVSLPRSAEGPSAGCQPGGLFDAMDGVQRDLVESTVFAPECAMVGDTVLVQVFAHLREQAAEAKAMAREFDDDATRRGRTTLATRIARGSRLTFELSMRNLIVCDAVQEIVWSGQVESVQFEVDIPQGQQPATAIGTVHVSQDSVPIGQIEFKLKTVAAATGEVPQLPAGRRRSGREPCGEAMRYERVFISYASQDRPEVLRRVQMLSAVGIECFQDILDLDPGERWERALYQHIDQSDVIFLFWSSAAKVSPWVEREWRYGLEHKGDDAIKPVIIEGPPIVPPPELAHLHFSDRVLYFIDA